MSRPATEGDAVAKAGARAATKKDVIVVLVYTYVTSLILLVALFIESDRIRTDLKAIQPCVGEKK